MTDQTVRQQALDVSRSFIVQAPAGSGKTELLIQRFLKLLIIVHKAPEEVLAITFTNKAANEMHERIMAALAAAQQPEPETAHKKQTWQLAKQVLSKDEQLGWHLLDNPQRLRIQTIDAFCGYIAGQLPVLSQLGGNLAITDNPLQDYQTAADQVLAGLETASTWQPALQVLIQHCHNDLDYLRELLVNMLAKREQWLIHVLDVRGHESRAQLESTLLALNHVALAQAEQAFPTDLQTELMPLLQFAQAQLSETDITQQFPSQTISDKAAWQRIQRLLQTQQGTWRKTIDRRNGFPTAKTEPDKSLFKQNKQRMLDLLASLAKHEALEFRLAELASLPDIQYTDRQWQVVEALINVLPILVAQLKVVFQQHNRVDYIEKSQAALQALNNLQSSDIALRLDYQLQHILVDEFQDTSLTQYRLLQLLTRHWQLDAGQTLFLVGDPMQSIYRFRSAEVGLYLQVQQYGLGQIQLQALTLTDNFRSSSTLVDWFNTAFSHILPQVADPALGAIPYSLATATQATDGQTDYWLSTEHIEQADIIADAIQQSLAAGQTVALLIRSRQQLQDIVPTLKQQQIPFQAIDIEPLATKPHIIDLVSLTIALLYLNDRLAWLSVLRAPWCGLLLADLTIIVNGDSSLIWQNLLDTELQKQLSTDGQQRVQFVIDALNPVLLQRDRLALDEWCRVAWLRLRGEQTLWQADDRQDCQRYFSWLHDQSNHATLLTRSELEQQLNKLYAAPANVEPAVQILTIHKAKGLEFDHVILPHLEQAPGRRDYPLLIWQEHLLPNNQQQLLLAPIKAKDQTKDSLYQYAQQFEANKDKFELQRLFYVATTRAKRRLSLLASIDQDPKKIRDSSFLQMLWPTFGEHFKQVELTLASQVSDQENSGLRRLGLAQLQTSKWQLPDKVSYNRGNQPHFQTELEQQRGTLVHHLLQQLSQVDYQDWSNYLDNTNYLTQLTHQYQLSHFKTECLSYLQDIVTQIQNSDTAAWLLKLDHESAASELAISRRNNHKIIHSIIDRTFIDDNVRWIIDYKTNEPDVGENFTDFSHRLKQTYQIQLNQYRQAFNEANIKCALYLPKYDALLVYDEI